VWKAATPFERDMYLVREGEVVDAAIARAVPGLRGVLAAARAQALSTRPKSTALTWAEQVIEQALREGLATDLTRPVRAHATLPGAPDESLAWARERARDLGGNVGRYRGIAPVAPWGTVKTTSKLPYERLEQADELATLKGSKYGVGKFGRGSAKGGRQSSETGEEEGTSKLDGKGELVPRAQGHKRIETSGAGEGTTGGPESAVMSDGSERATHDVANESEPLSAEVRQAAVASPARRRSRVPVPKVTEGGTEYPEWDWEAGDYRPLGAVVRTREPDISDDAWGNGALAQHGALVRRLRERFERLRARRGRLTQQRDGDELDLTACVRALVDQQTGHGVDDRMYIATRPARRGLAIALLIDISGSTDEWIDARRRVIDVEKVALLLASEALDALGDLYAIFTFSGKGRANVRMRTIKAFDESNGALVRRRIAALEPEGYTRAGAAIRHAAALLARQPAAHRLLLILSDGKPNDVDAYEGLAGVEDTRQAINEARRGGVYPFCLTIDRQGQDYLGRIFGEAGHTVLRNPQQLPTALVKVVKHLLAS
jgi:nitric oxide reductase NorD protein